MRRRSIYSLQWVACALCMFLCQPHSAQAVTFTVVNLNDSGSGSLRQAILDANAATGAHVIRFDVSGTITLASSLPVIARDIRIIGNASGSTINGSNLYQAFATSIQSDGFELRNMTITNCALTATFEGGSAVAVDFGVDVIIDNCQFLNNQANYTGGAVLIDATGTVTISRTLFRGNQSLSFFGEGGGCAVEGSPTLVIDDCQFESNISSQEGGGLYLSGGFNSTLTDCVFALNQAEDGAGLYAAGGGNSSYYLTACTFANNTASEDGGGMYSAGGGAFRVTIEGCTASENMATVSGGGIYFAGGGTNIVNVLNSTFSGNTAASGGGVFVGSGGTQSVEIRHATFSLNSASNGGGLLAGTDIDLINSIVANSTLGGDLSVGINGLGRNINNLVESCSGSTCPTFSLSIDPLLGPLQNNGGTTLTHALLAGSPAIDAGNPPNRPNPNVDQRGVARDVLPDLGGFEGVAPQPVELLDFTATYQDKVVQLAWTTGSETQNEGFQLQKSADTLNWEVLGWVPGKGNTPQQQSYTWVDTDPYAEGAFYRLLQRDWDGTFTYSPVIQLLPEVRSASLTVFPQPAREWISLSISGESIKTAQEITLYDRQGMMVRRYTESPNRISLAGLSPGIYSLKAKLKTQSLVVRFMIL